MVTKYTKVSVEIAVFGSTSDFDCVMEGERVAESAVFIDSEDLTRRVSDGEVSKNNEQVHLYSVVFTFQLLILILVVISVRICSIIFFPLFI